MTEKQTTQDALALLGLASTSWAHRLSNDLGAVRVLIKRLRDSLDDPKKANEYLNRIDQNVYRALNAAADIRQTGKLRAGSGVTPTSLNAAIRRTVSNLKERIPENVEVEINLDPNLRRASADSEWLDQMVENLILNAIDAVSTTDLPIITITTSQKDNEFLLIQVDDNGIGIPSEQMSKIFDLGFSTKVNTHSFGLGLWLIRQMVLTWGGDIHISSTPNHGTSVQLLIPIWEPANIEEARKKALIVDDIVEWRMILEEILETRGFTTFSASNTSEALDLLRENEFDIALLDVRLSEEDPDNSSGLSIAEIVKERNPEATIAMLTGYASMNTVKTAFSIGVDDFLDKASFSGDALDTLLDRVDQAIVRKQVTIESIRQSQTERYLYEILAMFSHEMRTPIITIQRNAEALEMEALGSINQDQRTAINEILSAAKRESELLNSHLDLNNIERGAEQLVFQKYDLLDLLRDEVLAHKPEAYQRNVKLRTYLSTEKATVSLDRSRFRAALNPLLENAIKFSPDKGQVFISAKVIEEYVEVRIKDEGPGMHPNEIDLLLSPQGFRGGSFSQRMRSSGLGISIAKRVIELHDGRLWIESDGKSGTTVGISIPIQGLECCEFSA